MRWSWIFFYSFKWRQLSKSSINFKATDSGCKESLAEIRRDLLKLPAEVWQKKSSHRNAQARVWHESSQRIFRILCRHAGNPTRAGLPSRLCGPQRKTEDGKMCKEGIKKAQIMRAVTRDDVRTSSRKRIPKWPRSIFVFDYREPKLLISSARVIVSLTYGSSQVGRQCPAHLPTWNKNKSLSLWRTI